MGKLAHNAPLTGSPMATHQLLTLRPAVADDVSVILQLIRELADYEKLLHEVVAEEADLHESLFGQRAAAQVVLAEMNGSAVGFALYHAMYSTFIARAGLYLEDLYVRPTQRGLGIGRALLRHLAQLATQKGYCRLDWSVLKWNAPALGFYRSIGARELEDWTRFRLDGEALMEFSGTDA